VQTLMRFQEVSSATLRKKTAIYDDIKAGRFPAPVKIGQRAVAWRRSDIEHWLASRPNATGVQA
jgi:prophage regulatory protein